MHQYTLTSLLVKKEVNERDLEKGKQSKTDKKREKEETEIPSPAFPIQSLWVESSLMELTG